MKQEVEGSLRYIGTSDVNHLVKLDQFVSFASFLWRAEYGLVIQLLVLVPRTETETLEGGGGRAEGRETVLTSR